MSDKLYYNQVTQEFGVSFDTLNRLYASVSLSPSINNIEDWYAYETIDRPYETSTTTVTELLPLFKERTATRKKLITPPSLDDQGKLIEAVVEDEEYIELYDGVQVWEVTDKVVTEADLTRARDIVKERITAKRWEVESGGLVFPNGMRVKTAKEDQDRILSVIINAERNGIEEIDFKAESGWATISLIALKQLAKELTRFVQFCFKQEKYHTEIVDSLTDITAIENYEVDSNWTFLFEEAQNTEVNLYDLSIEEVTYLLYSSFIFPIVEDGKLLVSTKEISVAQAIVDKAVYNMPELIPVQFYYLLSKTSLDQAIECLLPPLKEENIVKYSMYKSYLTGARYYEFSKTYEMYLDILPKLVGINPSLSFTLEQLKTLWTEAKEA